MYYSIIISLIEVVLVLVPALLGIAYVTIAERKTMASMQRRLGPNFVGQLKANISFKRSYHSSINNQRISELYLNRKAPVKPFEEKIVSVCKDLLSSTALNIFFKNLKGKGGIYAFTYKSDSNIYYIGRAKDFIPVRSMGAIFKAHLNINLKDRFHVFANAVG
jgi:formate hydrogenlyase subunit 4